MRRSSLVAGAPAGDVRRLFALALATLPVLVACGRIGFEQQTAAATQRRDPPSFADAGAEPVAWRSLTLPYAAGAAAAAVLPDGLHYLGGSSHYFAESRYQHHYVYDGASDSWSAAPADVPDSDTWGARAHVYQGKVYLLGGFPTGNLLRAYDPLTNAWGSLQASPLPLRWGFASGVIGDALFAFGGEAQEGSNAAGHRYDFGTNLWTPVAPIPQNEGRGALSSAVAGGRMYVLNGNPDDGMSVLQIYDAGSDRWSTGASLEEHAFEAAAAVAVGSKVYFIGGATNQDHADSSSEPVAVTNRVNIYDTIADRWSVGAPINVASMWATAALYEGNVHVLGGLDASSYELRDHEVLDL